MITIPITPHTESWPFEAPGQLTPDRNVRLVPPACMVDVFTAYIRARMPATAVADDFSLEWSCPSDDTTLTYCGEGSHFDMPGIWMFHYTWTAPHEKMTVNSTYGGPSITFLVWLVQVGERIEVRRKLHRHDFLNTGLKIGEQSEGTAPVIVTF